MMMVQYLMDADAEVVIPGIEAPRSTSATSSSRSRRARAGEARHRADQRARRPRPRASGDYSREQFMQWFIKEQIEEVASMSDLLRVVERAARTRCSPRSSSRASSRRRARGRHRAGRRRRRPVTNRRYARSPAPTGRWKWYDAIRRPVLK